MAIFTPVCPVPKLSFICYGGKRDFSRMATKRFQLQPINLTKSFIFMKSKVARIFPKFAKSAVSPGNSERIREYSHQNRLWIFRRWSLLVGFKGEHLGDGRAGKRSLDQFPYVERKTFSFFIIRTLSLKLGSLHSDHFHVIALSRLFGNLACPFLSGDLIREHFNIIIT